MTWDWDKLQEKRQRQQGQRPSRPFFGDTDDSDTQDEPRRARRSPFGDGGNGNGFDGKNVLKKLSGMKMPGGMVVWLVLGLVGLWLLSGIYIVNPDEEGVVLRFGKYERTEGPGPHYALPAPIESVYKPQVTQVLRCEVGFRSTGQATTFRQGELRSVPKEASMLTGDENIVNVQFSVQYKISDAVKYLFNISDPTNLVRNAAEAAMREVIGNSLIDSAITDGKLKIQSDATVLLQQVLDRYEAGIQVLAVQMQDVHPPQEVSDAFKDVASAREDKSRIINEAEAYRNALLPQARGEAAAMVNRMLGRLADKAAIDAHVGYGIQRIRRHIQSHMLHAGHGADAGKARSNRYFCGHLLIRRPLLVYIIPVLHQVFADLRTRSSRVRGRHFHSRFICSAGNGFIAQHDHFVCHIINHPFVNLSPVLPCPRNASGNWAPPDGSGSPVRAAPSGPS